MRMRWMQNIGSVSLSILLVGVSLAQDTSQNAPILNAFGRFWGIGYSQGYHRCDDGRLGWGLARDFHTSPIPNPALTAIYTAPYQPSNPRQHFNPVAWPSGAAVGMNQGMSLPVVPQHVLRSPATENVSKKPLTPNLPKMQMTNDGQKSPSDRTASPPRPIAPPPEWLKHYFSPDEVGGTIRLDGGLESVEQALPAKAVEADASNKSTSADDDLLVPKAAADDLLSPQTSSRATRQKPIYYAPTTRKPTPKTAGMSSNVWLSPVSPEMPSQRR